MMNKQNISTISDLRFKTKDVIKKAAKEPVYIFHRSVPQGVLLSQERYEDLLSTVEDYYVSLKAAEFEKEKKNKKDWVDSAIVDKMFNGK
ncbi:MAG: type II toxin-antitoxin system prevent-host-death family antitoxin [Patescibacteria group bacterium]